MKRHLAATVLAVLAVAGCAVAWVPDHSDIAAEVLRAQFQQFLAVYRPAYVGNAAEEARRLSIFAANMARAAALQTMEQAGGAQYGMTKFSDLTEEEFRAMYLGFVPDANVTLAAAADPAATTADDDDIAGVPDSVDWVAKGATTPVKNQGQCGSCWAFSATEEVESMYHLAGHPLLELAPQEVTSCVSGGCGGGSTIAAYHYLESHGLEHESSYPYHSGSNGVTGACKYHKEANAVHIRGFKYATKPKDETGLKHAVATVGPISICVDATTWQHYRGGIVTGHCLSASSDLDHCVQLTGYEASAKTPHWVVRNQWGTDWGEKGFIFIEMGKNLCGLTDLATYVTF